MNKFDKLIEACWNGDIENTRKLLKPALFSKAVNVNGIDTKGYSPLMVAIKREDIELYQLLEKKGADIDGYDPEICITPLHNAIKKSDAELVTLLIENGANVNCIINGETPLENAIEQGNVEVIKTLISNEADVNAKSIKGDPLIHKVVSEKNMEPARLLISAGADVNATNHEGERLLSSVLTYVKKDTVEYLISNGADVNAVNNDKSTAAIKAISTILLLFKTGLLAGDIVEQMLVNIIDNIPVLVANGADLDLENNKGESVHSLMKEMKTLLPEIYKMLDAIIPKP